MAFGCYLHLTHGPCMITNYGCASSCKRVEAKGRNKLLTVSIYSCLLHQDYWSFPVTKRIRKRTYHAPYKYSTLTCKCFAIASGVDGNQVLKTAALGLIRSYNALHASSLLYQLIPAVGIPAFALWGLGPLMRLSRKLLFHINDSNWRKSRTHYIFVSYLQPLLLWSGVTLICRALDPVILLPEGSQIIKQRLLNFVRSLSTVSAFTFCLSSLIQQVQKFFLETNDSNDARKMGFQFAGKALYTALWVAAFSLFMELLGFSTQKCLTAGGLGTVLLTLAGREIFTNFLSSVMIHATQPFVVNEWIQTRIEGYEVSGSVEHVGWWSPTIVRGDDREAVHIPNHKFTVNVVRNLSQKTHWRIKTHLAISHLDVDKINIIVADMRKVLAKNPQVEQQKLHRRVFLDNIDPENQALMILVSCFARTSHFEEYLCVKEAILLDLLRVISHHRARLATPIRTVQKMHGDSDIENIAYAETIFSHAGVGTRRPSFLIEPPTRINGEETNKECQSPRINEDQAAKAAASDLNASSSNPEDTLHANSDRQQPQKKPSMADVPLGSDGLVDSPKEKFQQKVVHGDASVRSGQMDPVSSSPSNSSTKPLLEELDALSSVSKETILPGAAIEKAPVSSSESHNEHPANAATSQAKPDNERSHAPSESHSEHASNAATSQAKPDSERSHAPPSPPVTIRPTFEENIVLGVALDGAKRTLPIEEGMGSWPTPVGSKELASLRSASPGGSPSSTKDKRDGQAPVPGGIVVDQRDQGR